MPRSCASALWQGAAVLDTCARQRQHSMTPWLTTLLMLKAGHLCMYKQPCWCGRQGQEAQDQLKLPISLPSLQGTTFGQQLLELACVEVKDPSWTILLKAGMADGNRMQAGGLA